MHNIVRFSRCKLEGNSSMDVSPKISSEMFLVYSGNLYQKSSSKYKLWKILKRKKNWRHKYIIFSSCLVLTRIRLLFLNDSTNSSLRSVSWHSSLTKLSSSASQTFERVSALLSTELSSHSWLCSVSWPPCRHFSLCFLQKHVEESLDYKVGYPFIDRSGNNMPHPFNLSSSLSSLMRRNCISTWS